VQAVLPWTRSLPFRFVEPGPLRDGPLELVEPAIRHGDDFLRAANHPTCLGDPECQVSPLGLAAFLQAVPRGRERGSRDEGSCSGVYRFWLRLDDGPVAGGFAGTVTLRVGRSRDLERYLGHLGYVVFPFARGQGLAERASRLLLPLARRHGMTCLWITTNPENLASRRTCERLGAVLVDEVALPRAHRLRRRGETRKARYRLDLLDA
jgi:tagatose 1,6-diphosphate aldolase